MRRVLLGLMAVGAVQDPSADPVVWVFFSPDSPDATRIFEQLRGRRVRPVLLVGRYIGDREPSEGFLATLRASGEVRVADDEGLREAERLGLRELPSIAWRQGGKDHVAAGQDLHVEEVIRCRR
jgi:hypothetical protein